MPPFLLRLIAFGIVTLVGSQLFRSKKKFEITGESNCDDRFKNFNKSIEISAEKVEKLKRAHYTIREKVKSYFQNYTSLPMPTFFIQGSYKTKTLIQNINEKCDVDLGVYLPYEPHVSFETVQSYLKKALNSHTSQGARAQKFCVRLDYVNDFHIDLPVYYSDHNSKKTFFGSRGYEWEESDPKGFIQWFNTRTHGKPQLVRVIRYLKAWLDHEKYKSKKKLPSGLALTLWAIEFYELHDRDDVTFYQTSSAILEYLNENGHWEATMPIAPYDDVLSRLNDFQQDFFYDRLMKLVEKGTNALMAQSKSQSKAYWREVFGYKFK